MAQDVPAETCTDGCEAHLTEKQIIATNASISTMLIEDKYFHNIQLKFFVLILCGFAATCPNNTSRKVRQEAAKPLSRSCLQNCGRRVRKKLCGQECANCSNNRTTPAHPAPDAASRHEAAQPCWHVWRLGWYT